MGATYTGDVAPEMLALHGRLRLLRTYRFREAERLRGSVEQMHSMLLTTLKSLSAKELSKPIDSKLFRNYYRDMRLSERRICEIDSEFGDVSALIMEMAS